MLTNQDLKKLALVFATKQDLEEMREEVGEFKETSRVLATAVDNLARIVMKLNDEYKVVYSFIDRHDEWIENFSKRNETKRSTAILNESRFKLFRSS